MDLGFGAKNHEIGQAAAQALAIGAEAQEKGLESDLMQYDRLLDDEVSQVGNDYTRLYVLVPTSTTLWRHAFI
jgi:hypothetical protein